jgi:hypothetical protein
MDFKNYSIAFFLSILLFSPLLAAGTTASTDGQQLIIGCRPWDRNMQNYRDLETSSFVDFFISEPPKQLPINFHHFDLNNQHVHSAGDFSDFARIHPQNFQTILIDWITYHHVWREKVWQEFYGILSVNGCLIMPITSVTLQGSIQSRNKAEEVKGKLTKFFEVVESIDYQNIQSDSRLELYKRPNLEQGRMESMMTIGPVIVIATKM